MHLAITFFYSSYSHKWVAFRYLINSEEEKIEEKTSVVFMWVEIL
jgi:hypothetical protein